MTKQRKTASGKLAAAVRTGRTVDTSSVRKFSLSVNRSHVGKYPRDGDWSAYNGKFKNESLTLAGLADIIRAGHAIAPALNGYRKADSFVSAQLLPLDVDEPRRDWTDVETVFNEIGCFDLFAIVHTTASSTPEAPRFRCIIAFDEPITDPDEYTLMTRALLHSVDEADPHCSDPARLFFGAPGCDLLQRDLVVSVADFRARFVEPYQKIVAAAAVARQDRERRALAAAASQNGHMPKHVAAWSERLIAGQLEWVSEAGQGSDPPRHKRILLAKKRLTQLTASPWYVSGLTDADIDDALTAISGSYLEDYGEKSFGRLLETGALYAEAEGPLEPPLDRPMSRPPAVPPPENWPEAPPPHQNGASIDTPSLDLAADYLDDYKPEDGGIADRWLDYAGERWRYTPVYDCWYQWTGTYWQADESNQVLDQLAKLVKEMNGIARARLQLANSLEDADQKKIAVAAARRWITATKRSKGRIVSLAFLVANRCSLAHDQLDQGNALNLANGTFDLNTMELRPHDRADYLTNVLPYAYDRTATCSRWEQFIDEVLINEDTRKPDPDLAALMQELFGYSLTNDVKHEVMALASGSGANGKTVALKTLAALLGPQAKSVNFHTLGQSGDYQLSALAGVRVILSTEAERGGKFAEGMLRRIVSGESLPARAIYGRPFSFEPIAKIWWAFNDPPIVRDTSNAIWRRMKLIPFHRAFAENERDHHLAGKLAKELPGILNWALVGLSRLRERGTFTAAAAAEAARAELRLESDPVGQWFDEKTEPTADPAGVPSELYLNYQNWATENGRLALSSTRWGRELKRIMQRENLPVKKKVHGGKIRYYARLTTKTINL